MDDLGSVVVEFVTVSCGGIDDDEEVVVDVKAVDEVGRGGSMKYPVNQNTPERAMAIHVSCMPVRSECVVSDMYPMSGGEMTSPRTWTKKMRSPPEVARRGAGMTSMHTA